MSGNQDPKPTQELSLDGFFQAQANDATAVVEAERLPDVPADTSLAHIPGSGQLMVSPGMDSTMMAPYIPMGGLSTAPTSTEETLQHLQHTVHSFMTTMNDRMSRLEQSVYYIQKAVEEQAPLAHELRNIVQYIQSGQIVQGVPAAVNAQPSLLNVSADNPALVQERPFKLRFRSLSTKWYTERLFPTFYIDVVDEKTGELYRKTPNWKATLRLKDGNGNYIDERIGDVQARTVAFTEGTAEVAGLKFTVVSSKRGNFFNLEAHITHPQLVSGNVASATSENLVVLSCRLFHNPKRPLQELSSDDALSKMPGIGRLYAERFASSGVRSIRQLADIPLGPEGRETRVRFLQLLRRDKGTMTEQRMVEYIQQAIDIVRKTDAHTQLASLSDLTEGGPAKKVRVDEAVAEAENGMAGATMLDVDDFINYSNSTNSPPKLAPFSFDVSSNNTDSKTWDQSDGTTRGVEPLSSDFDAFPVVSSSSPSVSTMPPLPNVHASVDMTGGLAHMSPMPTAGPAASSSRGSDGGGGVRATIQYPLHNAVGTNNILLVRNVVDAMREGGLPLGEENSCGWTPLMLAAAKGSQPIVELLCSLPGTDAAYESSVCGPGMTALHMAAVSGHTEVAQALLRQPGVDAGALNAKQFTPLMMATHMGKVGVVEMLTKVADSFRPKTAPGVGLYHLAAFSGSLDVMKLVHEGLRTYGMVVPRQPGEESTYGDLVWSTSHDTAPIPSVMHCAAFRGAADVVRWLLEHKVDPNVLTTEGRELNPLHLAAYGGHVDCVKLLAECGKIDVNKQSADGLSPLHYAAMNKGPTSELTVRALLDAGATEVNHGITASMVALSTNNMKALRNLLPNMVCPKAKKSCHDLSQFFDNEQEVIQCGRACVPEDDD